METNKLIEQAEQIWNAQQEYSTARAKLSESAETFTKALEAFGQALNYMGAAADTLRKLAAEFTVDGPEPERSHALAEQKLALQELTAWVSATGAAQDKMVPACWAVAETAIILHNAEHGCAPSKY